MKTTEAAAFGGGDKPVPYTPVDRIKIQHSNVEFTGHTDLQKYTSTNRRRQRCQKIITGNVVPASIVN